MEEMFQNNHMRSSRIILRQLFLFLISVSLLAGGVFLMSLRISGWSLILGLPLILFGFVFLVYSFDEIFRERIGPTFEETSCQVCQKTLSSSSEEKEKICQQCREEIKKRIKEETKPFS